MNRPKIYLFRLILLSDSQVESLTMKSTETGGGGGGGGGLAAKCQFMMPVSKLTSSVCW